MGDSPYFAARQIMIEYCFGHNVIQNSQVIMSPSSSYTDVVLAIQMAGLTHSVICLHSSLKSFGTVDGGADAIIQAFVDTGCTLVVPTFTYNCEVSAPPGRIIEQNGDEDYQPPDIEIAAVYNSHTSMIAREMGAIPARLLQRKGRVRSEHPLNSFAALGPLAAEIIAEQDLLNVYGPYKRVYSWDDAYLVLAGVGLTTATPIHFAEEAAGRQLFRRWAKASDGSVIEVQVGGCSNGFYHLDPVVKRIEKTVQAGQSVWRIFPFRPFIDTVANAVIQNPLVTHCDDPDCVRCRDAVRSGPIL